VSVTTASATLRTHPFPNDSSAISLPGFRGGGILFSPQVGRWWGRIHPSLGLPSGPFNGVKGRRSNGHLLGLRYRFAKIATGESALPGGKRQLPPGKRLARNSPARRAPDGRASAARGALEQKRRLGRGAAQAFSKKLGEPRSQALETTQGPYQLRIKPSFTQLRQQGT